MTHRFDTRVWYEDTDLGGIVYHANYLKFIERARSDWVEGLGIDQNAMRAAGQVFAVTRIEADFLRPARLGDRLSVQTQVTALRPARIVLAQDVTCGTQVLFRASVTLACLDGARPVRLPAALRQAFAG
ncbi:tol-pal system-associated acyl-CoA thioesterase [Falsirhodobacter algicola]|uniref:Tol-pal system-associated acyl-CoA thioesterase n=1 Tax=Falsirhodobacter algicola TaxID=2692330 RepID=A0A8J8MU65_9RHOB|nr:tol-pal system-associated acyl-CoA thioesterase [Falsirhodobacter algicola]QUS36796.1 tol-pal system-associated acyl-CoA thioesterase [Falsirhodobacter algicola]